MLILNEGIFDKPAQPITGLIFLDIDGVLCTNSEFCLPYLEDDNHPFNESCLRNLESIIDNANAHIVISSSWRKRDLDWIRGVFKLRGFKYPERIIGETMRAYQFVEKGCHLPIGRGTEIKAWIDKFILYKEGEGFVNKPVPYVIIDDDRDMLLTQQYHFINTDTECGLDYDSSDKCIEILLGL